MQHAWWIEIVKWILVGVVFIFIGKWFRRYGFRVRPSPDRTTLKQPLTMLITGVMGFIFWGGFAVVSNTIGKNETTTIWSTAIFIFFSALMSLVMIAYYFTRHHLSPEGLDYGRLLRKRGFFRWSDIREIQCKPRMGWFLLRAASGSTIRISALTMGLPEFAQHVLAHVPPDYLDSATKPVLMTISAGKTPANWK